MRILLMASLITYMLAPFSHSMPLLLSEEKIVEVNFQQHDPIKDLTANPEALVGKALYDIIEFEFITVTSGNYTTEELKKIAINARVRVANDKKLDEISQLLATKEITGGATHAIMGKAGNITGVITVFLERQIGIVSIPDKKIHLNTYYIDWK